MKLIPLKSAPSSSRWDLAAVRGDVKYWRARSGKLYVQRGSEWFRVAKDDAK